MEKTTKTPEIVTPLRPRRGPRSPAPEATNAPEIAAPTPAPTPTPKRPEPDKQCFCNVIIGTPEIEVYPGGRGHVVIKQHDEDHDEGYSMIFVKPQDVPQLMATLEHVAKQLENATVEDFCPVHA